MKALLDTNFLMVPGEFNVDVLSDLLNLGYSEVYTIDLVVIELEKLSVGGGKKARSARIGLKFVSDGGIVVLKAEESYADDEIVRLAKTKKYVACTQDKGLINKLRRENLRYVTLHHKKYLVESGRTWDI
jgi:rRNA-processing protein FCF1